MKGLLLAGVLVLGVESSALAQVVPRFDVSGGYSFLRLEERELGDVATLKPQRYHGWMASAAGYLRPWLGVTGELGGAYREVQLPGARGTHLHTSVYSVMIGPRLTARPTSKVTPFVQWLLGANRERVRDQDAIESATQFLSQLGGGADFWVGEGVGLRAGMDYRRIFRSGGIDAFRFYVGVVVTSGE